MVIFGKPLKIDLQGLVEQVSGQFQGLDPREPGQWPLAPRIAVWVLVALAVVVLGWLFMLSEADDGLTRARDMEPRLKADYRDKLAQAVNLDELRKQKEQVQEYVTQLEKQLPGKAEMDALLSDINQAGVGRGLQFEFFKPGQVVVKDYYAELPIAIRVTGRFHDIGAFAADVANLSRIVTLHNLVLQPSMKDSPGTLALEATARTYRYLDPTEVAEVRRASGGKGGAKKANP